MRLLLKIGTLMMWWGVVGWILLRVDPEQVKNLLLPGSYLPMMLALGMAMWYSGALIIRSKMMSFVFTIMGIFLGYMSIFSLLTPFVLVASGLFFGYIEYWLWKNRKV